MFIDEATVTVAGGPGGDGCVSFRREKYVPRGGPDGGDGGHGGKVIFVADNSVSTLLEFRYRPLLRAERGRHGQGSDKTGRAGQDLLVRVPVGTVVYDDDRVELLADLEQPEQQFVAAQGGRGGRGNARFKSSIQQAPRRRELGQPGQERRLRLELKLLADVGLLGFPNAGKSTLISRLSAARPKIADYPFTTLEPSLGVVDRGDYSTFVIADVPGLIEGAHRGAGLGDRFLRHVERCRLLLHLVDPTTLERDPLAGIDVLNRELRDYGARLAGKPQIWVVTKADAVDDPTTVESIQRLADERGIECLVISAVSGVGLPELVQAVGRRLDRLQSGDRDTIAGVLGGTFDPVHAGHLELADGVRQALHLPRVLLVPAGNPPFKADATPTHHREAMVRLALRDRPGLELSRVELLREGASFTIDTLRELRETTCRPLFILGMDAVAELPTWHESQVLLAEFDWIAVDRPGRDLSTLDDAVARRIFTLPDNLDDAAIDALELGRGGRIFRLPLITPAVSSSAIRLRVASGLTLDGLVPPEVDRYIQSNKLYAQEDLS